MINPLKKKPIVGLALVIAFALLTVQAHADKWATATFHSNRPVDQIFKQTAILADGTKWGFRTTSHIESTNVQEGTIQAALIAGGAKWGCMYMSIRAEGTGTFGEAVVSLRSDAWHNPGTFADGLVKALHKSFPDLEYEVKRDTIPNDFAFGISQVSLPLVPPIAPLGQPTQSSATQPSSIQYSLQEIASSLSQGTSVLNVGTTTTSRAVKRFLSDANLAMNRFMVATGSEEESQFRNTAMAVNKARDDAYATLTNALQRGMFNQITNDYMITFGKQMADHASHASTDPATQSTRNLHQALDAWYANGKDWTKIPSDVWSKLPERDKGRLKDGIDPEMVAGR